METSAALPDRVRMLPAMDSEHRHRAVLPAHVTALDGLRAVAVGLVVLTHAAYLTGFVNSGGFWGVLLGRGDFGVALFFTLSGYLLHLGFLRAPGERLDIGTYLLRRAARVLPAYWVVLLVVCVAARPDARDVVLHALALQIYAPGSQIPSFSPAWSIATELSFYAVLPIAAALLHRVRRQNAHAPLTLLAALLPLALACTWLAPSGDLRVDTPYERWLPARSASFLIGMILAEAVVRQSHPLARRLRAWMAAPGPVLALGAAVYALATTPVAGLLTLGIVSGWQLTTKMLLSCVFAAALLGPVVLGPRGWWTAWLSRPGVVWVGRISYGIFLWHVPVFVGLYALTGVDVFTGGLAALLAIGVPITVALAAVSFAWIEAPAIRWASLRRRSPAAAEQVEPQPPRSAAPPG